MFSVHSHNHDSSATSSPNIATNTTNAIDSKQQRKSARIRAKSLQHQDNKAHETTTQPVPAAVVAVTSVVTKEKSDTLMNIINSTRKRKMQEVSFAWVTYALLLWSLTAIKHNPWLCISHTELTLFCSKLMNTYLSPWYWINHQSTSKGKRMVRLPSLETADIRLRSILSF